MAANVYGTAHQMFLQGMMCRKVCSAAEVRALFRSCCAKKPLNFEENIGLFIREINSKISCFHMEIRKGVDEEDGSQCYCLINTHESVLSLQASDYTPHELEYFQKLIEEIVRSPNGFVSSIEALNLSIDLSKSMSPSDADHLLKRLSTEKWIVERKGKIYMSPLTILEFDVYIKEMFSDDVQLMCSLCKQIVINGEMCTDCGAKFHRHCIKRASLKACIRCKSPLPHHSASGKSLMPTLTDDEDDSCDREASVSTKTKRRRR